MALFSRCKKAELTDAVSGEKVAAGVSVGSLDSLMIAAPLACKIEVGEPVQIKFLDPALGVVTCVCKLTAPLLSGDKRFYVYRCQVLEQLSQEQRREDIKVPLNVQVKVSLGSVEAPAILRNISASGVYLTTTLSARPKDHLTFVFREAGAPIPLTAEILRAELTATPGSMGYGCRFVRLATRYESQLRAYVFQEERRQRKS